MRVDFNVPLKDGKVESDKRLRESLPTIKYLRKKEAKVILMSHLGRPDGKRVPDMSLRPVADALAALLGAPVAFAEDCVGPAGREGGRRAGPRRRAAAREPALPRRGGGERSRVRQAAGRAGRRLRERRVRQRPPRARVDRGDHQVRAAGGVGLPDEEGARLPGRGAREPEAAVRRRHRRLEGVGQDRRHQEPAAAGRQAADRRRHDLHVPEGAGAGGRQVDRRERQARAGAQPAGRGRRQAGAGDRLRGRPTSWTSRGAPWARPRSSTRTTIPADWEAVDIGPETIAAFTKILLGAKTIVWNGPVGVFEIDATAKGTIAIAEALAKATAAGATTIIGGGDSASAVKKAGVASKVSHVSTGGGASLEFLEGKVLPGVAALSEKK